ncbi:CD209 antigen-like protein E [Lates calcarifer]|uniref:CD209 antigen-like protein E n=1 Tax=Lates calcarifer TaxID=8187 RepID=A0AAJ7V3Z2_LATCA|nr:CD209 antigen-like protein E [Lates calcarifer]
MSVELNSKTAEVKRDSCTLMAPDDRSKYGWLPQIPVWWIGAAAVCLGFLLLLVILGLVAQNGRAISHWKKLQVGLMECENLVYNLTKDRDALRDERDQLKRNSSSLKKELDVLQSQYKAVAASRDKLQEDVRRLNHSKTERICYQGWIKFNNKCYYASDKGAAKTWEESRKDCLQRRADLVIITTKDELVFVSKFYSRTWIGLSDMQQENKWRWVDGSDLEGRGFWQSGEPNNVGNEDCVELSNPNGEWNDMPCENEIPWMCED